MYVHYGNISRARDYFGFVRINAVSFKHVHFVGYLRVRILLLTFICITSNKVE